MTNRILNYIKQAWTIKADFFKIPIIIIKEKISVFDDELSIVCIAKNEGDYIQEWVVYHLLAGVDRIYIYDNGSTDDLRALLNTYIKAGKVIYTFLPGKAAQLVAYRDAIKRFKNKTKYMAFIDCDEFLISEDHNIPLKEAIRKIFKLNGKAGGIAVNWRMYGSSGHITKPKGLVTENFQYRGDGNSKGSECIKTIANPRFIKEFKHVHYPRYFWGFNNIDEKGNIVLDWRNPCEKTSKIRINHYFTKSKEEWIIRRQRGKADTFDEDDKRTIAEFYEHDHNDLYDDIMLFYTEKIKEYITRNDN